MKKNITIIGLTNDYKRNISKALADELDMIFADINELMEFNFINSNMLETAGQDYYDKNERKTIQTITSYESTVITLNFSTFNKSDYSSIIKNNSLVIYLRQSFEDFVIANKKEVSKSLLNINKIAFNDRDKLMLSYCDIKIDIENESISECVEKILIGINNYYKEGK